MWNEKNNKLWSGDNKENFNGNNGPLDRVKYASNLKGNGENLKKMQTLKLSKQYHIRSLYL